MQIKYIETELNVMQRIDLPTKEGEEIVCYPTFIKGETRTDYIDGEEIVGYTQLKDSSGGYTEEYGFGPMGSFVQVPVIVDLWQEGLAAGAVLLPA